MKEDYKYISETGRHRSITVQKIEKYFGSLSQLNGLDIGFGGDPLLINSICMDMPERYSINVIETAPQNLFGDCRNLYWFSDCCLDYVYSAHVLEDFLESEIKLILKEWVRIVKNGGLLILDLPNERKYRDVCKQRGYRSNPRHLIIDMSPNYILDKTRDLEISLIDLVEDLPPDNYSFLMIWKKLATDQF
jgi:SAM-dependent methyltransferase